eukprot:8444390-Pyramimonas_sp.AAC.1
MCHTSTAIAKLPGLHMCHTSTAITKLPGLHMCHTSAAIASAVFRLRGSISRGCYIGVLHTCRASKWRPY